MNTETKSPFDEMARLLSGSSKEERNIELLHLLEELVDETKNVKVAYKGNENNPEMIDFFLNGKYVESSIVQPKIFLDFRAAKIEQGFVLGATFIIEKIFENIQKSGNESK